VVDNTRDGRHRTAARYNPFAELSTIVKSAGETGVKASAVLAASGGLVAAFALPAQAAPVHRTSSATASTTTAVTAPGAEVSTRVAAAAAVALAPAVVAPQAAAPVAVDPVGVVGVKAVAKPKPKPKPKPAPDPVVQAVQSRSDGNSNSNRNSNRSSNDKRTAPVSRSSTRYTNPEQSSSQVVNIARTLLGIPYVYGGSSPSGFDCSGFTQYVFGKAGISIPRTASAQQRAATAVSDPKPGDLVFFGSPAWHVGIYTGKGMMIDSPRRGKSTSERPIFSGVSGYGRF
jgi:cell wall-associated NlpC family hydrolase